MTAETETRSPEFLTVRELAELLRIKERKVYDLASSGEVPCSRVTGKLLFPKDAVRAWIDRASTPGEAQRPPVFLGSHDPLLEWAIRQSRSGLATLFDGGTDGLARFQAREGVAAGLHIHDPGTETWNVPVVADACRGANVVLVGWALRRRGLVLRKGVSGITGIADLAGRRVVQRQPESGAQTLFEHALAKAGLSSDALEPTPPARSETDAVLAVAQGAADVGFGLEALARAFGLAFLPIIEERFDLLVDRGSWFEPPMQRLMGFCATPEFRAHAANLAGYDISDAGKIRWNA